MLTIEELMLPRYKVIIRYPHYPFDGDVLVVNEQGELIHETEGYPQSIYKILEKDIKDNPCFRLMAWHEDRKPEDLPEYVKWKEGAIKTGDLSALTICGKVVSIDYDRKGEPYFNIEKEGQMPAAKVKPATEAEYLAYTNSTTKQD